MRERKAAIDMGEAESKAEMRRKKVEIRAWYEAQQADLHRRMLERENAEAVLPYRDSVATRREQQKALTREMKRFDNAMEDAEKAEVRNSLLMAVVSSGSAEVCCDTEHHTIKDHTIKETICVLVAERKQTVYIHSIIASPHHNVSQSWRLYVAKRKQTVHIHSIIASLHHNVSQSWRLYIAERKQTVYIHSIIASPHHNVPPNVPRPGDST
jgi:hydroxyacyl-ACP dehydratase HTD2-like protein with hotdog domain